MSGKGASASVRLRRLAAAGLALLFLAGIQVPSASANDPRIVNARVVKIGKESYIFEVTVAHADDSWDHYLDKWEVVGPGGKILGTVFSSICISASPISHGRSAASSFRRALST